MPKKIPQRMCVGCQQMFDKRKLLRVVKTPENDILIDTTGKKAGRGAYICDNIECFKKVIKAKRLEKTFKTKIPENIYEKIKEHFNE